jgi:hypothetical protein
MYGPDDCSASRNEIWVGRGRYLGMIQRKDTCPIAHAFSSRMPLGMIQRKDTCPIAHAFSSRMPVQSLGSRSSLRGVGVFPRWQPSPSSLLALLFHLVTSAYPCLSHLVTQNHSNLLRLALLGRLFLLPHHCILSSHSVFQKSLSLLKTRHLCASCAGSSSEMRFYFPLGQQFHQSLF